MKAAAQNLFPVTVSGVRLPEYLGERCRLIAPDRKSEMPVRGRSDLPVARENGESPPKSGSFVLYWMRTAVRADENPALDVAIYLATELQLPLLVYHGLSESYQYASDRHHMFILEGARDVQVAFDRMGISYAFHLERPGHDGDYLRQLSGAAAILVTEDMPVPPASSFLSSLMSGLQTPILCVDTACVVPMQLTGRAYDRAFEYRRRTEKLYRDRVTRSWPVIEKRPLSFDFSGLPFQPLDLQQADFSNLIGQCRIDHSVGPVVDTRGGSIAGYQRWISFRERGLKLYAARRNNALVNGVSRMSAYLHYGMVSPFRIAREAADLKHEGAEKYLDELLIWRELAYSFCFYTDSPYDWSALPSWARKTLEEHATDPREVTYSWEELARAGTHDLLWNAAQKSLLIHGELHNNVRMTWGKAFLSWTDDPKQALRLAFDLNDRFALDGRDPASVGGILWCFGQFDRPFFPEQPVYGTVRTRPTEEHARRLDVRKYGAMMSASRLSNPLEIAVIGAGVSGATAARVLSDHGLKVTVFEKSQGAGGRMATRRSDLATFDHGAPYFTATSREFRRVVRSWVQQGLVARWTGIAEVMGETALVPRDLRYVGIPGMSAVGKHLAQGLDVRLGSQIQSVRRRDRRFVLTSSSGDECGCYDRVIIAIPATQAVQLMDPDEPLHGLLKTVRYEAVWAVLLALDDKLPVSWQSLTCNNGAIRWISRESSKPGRSTAGRDRPQQSAGERLVVHSSAVWASERLEEKPEAVLAAMMSELEALLGIQLPQPIVAQAHRWRYSQPVAEVSGPSLVQFGSGVDLLACGDWDRTPGIGLIESAYLSGIAAAGRILRTLNRRIGHER